MEWYAEGGPNNRGQCHEELKKFYLQPKIAEDETEKERRTCGNNKGSKYF